MSMTAEQIVAKWQQRATSGSAKQSYIDGTQSVTESPMAKAADADALFLARVEDSVRSGRRAAKLRSIPLQKYKDGTRAKADRYSSGITAAVDSYRQQMQKWAGVYQQASEAAKALPHDGSTESALNRVRAAIQVMKNAAGRS